MYHMARSSLPGSGTASKNHCNTSLTGKTGGIMTKSTEAAPIKKAEVFVFRAPIENPVRTSFGIMYNRPAVILRVEDEDKAYGWGEVWCNFPSCGAEHRGRLLAETILPLALNRAWSLPIDITDFISRKLRILRLQCDEPGPFNQCLAGVDIALWDLKARKAGLPLHKLLGNASMTVMPAYASGINHPGIAEIIKRSREEGYRIFKIKIGFGEQQDQTNIETAFAAMQAGEKLAVDVNQGWSEDQALANLPKLQQFPLLWIEEPIACDQPPDVWRKLAACSAIPLSGGENIRSMEGFNTAIREKFIRVVQPDICKWGGLSHCREVAMNTLANGLTYCPHYLGGGIGLIASAHLLAAAGGNGMLEIDCNPNPLRELLAKPFPKMQEGNFVLTEKPGLGVDPDLNVTESMLTYYQNVTLQ